jgi:hypothetical protein
MQRPMTTNVIPSTFDVRIQTMITHRALVGSFRHAPSSSLQRHRAPDARLATFAPAPHVAAAPAGASNRHLSSSSSPHSASSPAPSWIARLLMPPPLPPSPHYARADKKARVFFLYDGGCPLCTFEMSHMQRMAAKRDAPACFVVRGSRLSAHYILRILATDLNCF